MNASDRDREVVDALRATLKERDRLRRENAMLLSSSSEPIAIIGMSCRFPGEIETPRQLWDLVASGGDAISGFPEDRGWELERLYDPDPDAPGTTYVREGGFLADPAGFDAQFFGLGPQEALATDAQYRLTLECCWEALEDAGLDPLALKGSQTGVFSGLCYYDYGVGAPWDYDLEGYLAVGMSPSISSGRVAYQLGFEGPALTLDTACSSSLVTMHLAIQSLRRGECSLALAGGTSVIASATPFIDGAPQRSMAPDGRCKAFAEAADGVGFGEGAGIVALERLSDAERNGHRVLAIIRGSAINQDGASNGLSAPSCPAQEKVIRQALASAQLEPGDVDAVEAHGTGTTLGDPIEANALLATYGQDREEPLWLGSIKSNIGHTQAAAGVAGVIKMVMAIREGLLPATLHVDAPSSKIEWDAGSVELLREPRGWQANGHPRRAGVSSFGISGTNAHLILEEAPPLGAGDRVTNGQAPEPALAGEIPLVLSAKSEAALRESAARLDIHLEQAPDLDIEDVAYSLATCKPSFERRAVVVGRDRAELRAELASLAAGNEGGALVTGFSPGDGRPVFIFPGYGSQWQGMALELIESSPVFARRMDECAEAFEPHLQWSLGSILRGEEDVPALDWPLVGFPALFATMVSLVELWRSCGVEPGAVVGHSQGEMVAAHVAGALTLDEAAYAVMARLEVMLALEGDRGTMAAVALCEEDLIARLEQWQGRLGIAALNGPASSVVSGDVDAVEELIAQCKSEGIQARKIRGATGASHSHHVDPLREPLLEALGRLEPRSSSLPFHSTVSGGPIDTAELSADYWYRNLRQTVRLAPVVRDLIESGSRTLIEISPHPVLHIGLAETARAATAGSAVSVLGTLRHEEGGSRRFALSFAEAWVAGAAVDWDTFFAGSDARAVPLPAYPFQRTRFWLAGSVPTSNGIGLADAAHPLLGAAIEDPGRDGLTFAGKVSLQSHPWLADHAGAGTVSLPDAAFVELALRAGRELACGLLEELTPQAPLVLPEAGGVDLRVVVDPPGERGERAIAIYSRGEAEGGERPEWACNAKGIVSAGQPRSVGGLGQWPPAGAEPLELDGFYERIADLGFEYGPAFQGLTAAWRAGDDLFAEVSLATEQAGDARRFEIHPALLDAVIHGILALPLAEEGETGLRVPCAWRDVALHGDGVAQLRVRIRPEGTDELSLLLADQAGAPVATVGSLRVRAISAESLGGLARKQDELLALGWTEIPATDDGPAPAGEVKLVRLEELDFAVSDDLADSALAATRSTLELAQEWLGPETSRGARLVVLTEGAVATGDGEDADPVGAAVWGLLRSARSESLGRIALIDSDGSEMSEEQLAVALALSAKESELALRDGRLLVPRLVEAARATGSLIPPAGPWQLAAQAQGSLEGLGLVPAPSAQESLGPGQVRVAVRAAGLSFLDLSTAPGPLPGESSIGGEAAGVVVEVGPEVEGFAVGDRVIGMVAGAFGPLAIAEAQLLVALPAAWSYEQGAAVPLAYATAHFHLFDAGSLTAGERVLVHAGAGAVGMAAIQLARRAGAEVFATASPSEWGALRELGLAEDHIASSRDPGFRQRFLAQTGGEGVDVVLNSLTGELIDASLDLMPRGGRFLEIGEADRRDPEQIAATHPGVAYHANDIAKAKPDRVRESIAGAVALLEAGELRHAPLETWDVRRAPEAFRRLQEGRIAGQIVLTMPGSLDPDRTVLITGGTSGLGALFARHLVSEHGARHLLLVSRSGASAAGAGELAAELEQRGATVRIEACDVSSRAELEALLGSIGDDRPLGAVVHSAGALADGSFASLGEEQLRIPFAAKAGGAWHLHELTREMGLSTFVLVSSFAGTVGTPGQANYAAANSFLDALAARRRAEGLAAVSMAWGAWEESGAAAAVMTEAGRERFERGGLAMISDEKGLELFDAALRSDLAQAAPILFEPQVLRRLADAGALPPLLTAFVSAPRRRRDAANAGALAAKLAQLAGGKREAAVLEVVRTETAAVLGDRSPAEVDPDVAFKDLGFDSLAVVELRNRMSAATGIELATTVGFDYPTPRELGGYLLREMLGGREVRRAVVRAQVSEEPIAIVGMACRYAGGVQSPRDLWELVATGGDGIAEFPSNRGWDLERLYHPDPEHRGTTYQREGGFLHDAADFDPAFFGISPREALVTDPQHRLLLENAWEALEDAGIDPSSLRGSPTGTFAGISSGDYMFNFSASEEDIEGHRVTGIATSVASGRIAYLLGLEGPAITVDTACSSSLVAIHLAMRALHSGECSLALAGGASVLATPDNLIEFARQRAAAVDGRSKSFADGADGMGLSEGVGMLVLERLSQAEAGGRRVLATIRGSALNQDGASNGLTAPSGRAQERVILQALANAGMEPKDIDAVEAHGTGTVLGDPIEASALLATYGQDREAPLWLGSVKSNIGHSLAAAGVAGVIKTVMSLREGLLPKTLHAEQPSTKVDWDSGRVELLQEAVEWKANGRPRRAGVSSFGISGTNAHMIIEEGQGPDEGGGEREPAGPVPLVLSAKTTAALRDLAGRLAQRLDADPGLDPRDLAFSLATTRPALSERAVVVGEGREQLLDGLRALAGGESAAGTYVTSARPGRLAYLFPGQGSQRAGMGQGLYAAQPVYAKSLDQVCEALDEHLERPLREVLFAAPGSAEAELLDHTSFAQPALFATGVALYRLLESLGLEPDLLAGHSVGEISAAHLAGVFSLADAAKLVCARGRLMGELPSGGAMLALEASEEEALESLRGKQDLLSLAAVNGPAAVVVSGDAEALVAVEDEWAGQGRKTKRLAVSHAFHSPLIEPMLERFAEVAASLAYEEPRVPLVSDVSGALLGPEQATDPAYWVRHAREAVRFADVVATLEEEGATTYLELGPDPVLSAMTAAALGAGDKATLIPTLREGREESGAVLLALGAAHAAGAAVAWDSFFAGSGARAVPLPTYPFQRRPYWIAGGPGGASPSAVGLADADSPLLGAAVEDPRGGGLVLTGRISLASHPWLADHRLAGTALLPSAAFVEMALVAADAVGASRLDELLVHASLPLPDAGGVQLQVRVEEDDTSGGWRLCVHARPEPGDGDDGANWTLHAEGTLSSAEGDAAEGLAAWPPEGAEPIDVDLAYDRLAQFGIEHGPALQGLTAAWRLDGDLFAEVSLAEPQLREAGRYRIHPVLLDAALHVAMAGEDEGTLRLPVSWRGVELARLGAGELRVKIATNGDDGAALTVAGADGAPLGRIGEVRVEPVPVGELRSSAGRESLLGLEWKAIPVPDDAGGGERLPTMPVDLRLEPAEDPVEAARAAVQGALALVESALAEQGEERAMVALLSTRAVAATAGETVELEAAAAMAALLSAQAEHPGRFVLIDSDGSEESARALDAALAAGADEPQLALRGGRLLAPRIEVPAIDSAAGGQRARGIDPGRTILVIDGLAGIGALIRRHLAERHGAEHVLLLEDAPDRAGLEEALASIEPEHPLGAVICAGHPASPSLAWQLHELTKGLDLSAFVLFSSAIGSFGGPGVAGEAGDSAFLDALARRRHAEGLAAVSVGWGRFEREGAGSPAEALGETNQMRLRRLGGDALADEEVLAFLDAALCATSPTGLAMRVDRAGLRSLADVGALPPLLRGLLPRRAARWAGPALSLAERLASLPQAEHEGAVRRLVRTEVAAVLGHSAIEEVPLDRPFNELGFDSLAAVETRNRLGLITGLQLPTTVVFDYPTVEAIAAYLLRTAGEEKAAGVEAELARLEATLGDVAAEDPRRAGLAAHLRALAADLEGGSPAAGADHADRLETASDEELLSFIDEQIGG
jgi:polyene macrolide polyketide synthase